MKGADMYIGWVNSTGGVTVGNFLGGGHSPPTPNSNQNRQVVPLMDPMPTWSKLSFSFCRATTLNGNPLSPTSGFIYAASESSPSGTLESLNLPFHDTKGPFQPDFSSSNVPVVTTGGGSTTV
ncbi:hypothetical protein HDV06_002821, partial [Boothiomyces sp. JEL0866]